MFAVRRVDSTCFSDAEQATAAAEKRQPVLCNGPSRGTCEPPEVMGVLRPKVGVTEMYVELLWL